MNASRRHEGSISAEQPSPKGFRLLAYYAAISFICYAIVAFLSRRFDYHVPGRERPILPVLLYFAIAYAIYILGVALIKKIPEGRHLLSVIVGAAIGFRAILLFSVPIQEIDMYRYVWDGAVSTTGVSPFAYSPEQVLAASLDTADLELRRLLLLLEREPNLDEILARVHFAELPTIYPPTSQLVFAMAGLTTAPDTSVMGRLVIMKLWILVFDLATFWLIIRLLKMGGMHSGYLLVYAWCPLLLKEVANSGHLDAIAVFFTTLSVFLTARILHSNRIGPAVPAMVQASLSLLMLALAIGAKIYPVVLTPLVLFVLVKKMGVLRIVLPTILFAAATFWVLLPMFPRPHPSGVEDRARAQVATDQPHFPLEDEPPALTDIAEPSSQRSDPSEGLQAFIRHWEMNDFVFLILVENLKPTANLKPHRIAWFSILPEPHRLRIREWVGQRFHVNGPNASFLITRAILSIVFFVVAISLAWNAARSGLATRFCEAVFLTLAWFWLLCPTQNPWYWTWALPFLPFARSRAWLAMSGLVFLYYLRFYFQYHFPHTGVFGSRYDGARFFDFIVTWIEFAPWFVWLAIASRFRQADNSTA